MSRVFRTNSYSGLRTIPFTPSYQSDTPSAEDLLLKARQEAARIISDATSQADAIKEQASQSASEIEKKSQEKGFVAGYEDGYKDAVKELEKTLCQAEGALEAARNAFKDMIKQAEPHILALCMAVSKKIAGDAVTRDQEAAIFMLREALSVLRDEKEFVLRVNPKLVAFFRNACDKVIQQYGTRSIEVVADKAIKEGAVLESQGGFVDATIETAIRNICLSLAEAKAQKEVSGQ